MATTNNKRPLDVGRLPAPKRSTFPATNYGLFKELGECASKDVDLLERMGWENFAKASQ